MEPHLCIPYFNGFLTSATACHRRRPPDRFGGVSVKEGKIIRGLKRIATPGFVISLYYWWRFGARVSSRAEVDLTPNLTFGRNCRIEAFSKIKCSEGVLSFGDRATVATGCFITSGAGETHIGDDFQCGPNVNIVGQNYIHSEKGKNLEDLGIKSVGIRLGNGVMIGAGTTIVDGAAIGHNSLVLPNSLVNRRYPEGAILGGNPAKLQREEK
ncbi:MAG: acyltransferase [Sphingomonadaceae bacterium]